MSKKRKRSKNCNDLRNLSFISKIPIFSEAYLEPSRKFTMKSFYGNGWKTSTIFTKKLHHRCLAGF